MSIYRYSSKFFYGITVGIVASSLVFGGYPAPIKKAEANAGLGGALEVTQLGVRGESITSATQNTATAANTGLSAAADTALLAKENILDGIGWAIAKQMVSSMTRSMINWVNSGFQGSPAFITDLKQHLLNAVDQAAGEYIASLGGVGEFICSPFRLDVQAALAISYQQSRSGMPSGPTACTLTDIGNNITDFLEGTSSGWGQWFEVTANPQNTPYGAYLEAEAKLNARLVNAAGQEITLANWSGGFLSNKVCEPVEGGAPGAENCTITTPGEVISEALTFQLSTGPQSLVEADEINELIGALMNQLLNQALQGVNGLLGLGGNAEYTADYDNDPSNGTQSYLDEMIAENLGLTGTSTDDTLSDQIALEGELIALADETIRLGNQALEDNLVVSQDGTYSSSTIRAVVRDAEATREQALLNQAAVEDLLDRFNASGSDLTGQQRIIAEYIDLLSDGNLTTQALLAMKELEWGRVISEDLVREMIPVMDNLFELYEHQFFPTLNNLLTPPTAGTDIAFSSDRILGCSAIVSELSNKTSAGTNNAYRAVETSDSCYLYESNNTDQVTTPGTGFTSDSFIIHTHGERISFAELGGPTVNSGAIGPTGLDFVNYCRLVTENPDTVLPTMFVYANSGLVWRYSIDRSRCGDIVRSDDSIKKFLLEATAYDICRIYQASGGGNYNRDKFAESYFASVTNRLFPGREWGTDADEPIEEAYLDLLAGAVELDESNYHPDQLNECIQTAKSTLRVTVEKDNSGGMCRTICDD